MISNLINPKLKRPDLSRSYNMSMIKSKNTKPEMVVRKALTKLGYRYRLHGQQLPGKPDIVFTKKKSNFCKWVFLA